MKDLEATNLTRLDQVIGTPQYIAPESIMGQHVTTATDMYQTGLVLYRMLAGRSALTAVGPATPGARPR